MILEGEQIPGFIAFLESKGVRLEADGDQLVARGAVQDLTENEREMIRSNKATLLYEHAGGRACGIAHARMLQNESDPSPFGWLLTNDGDPWRPEVARVAGLALRCLRTAEGDPFGEWCALLKRECRDLPDDDRASVGFRALAAVACVPEEPARARAMECFDRMEAAWKEHLERR